ncbi:MAG: radical SAM/SPASM domain-containing protein [Anaerolineae bacterium]
MFALSPETVLRPEPDGALMFQRETAETALLDLEGLDALYSLLKGQLRDYPVFFVGYLLDKGFVVSGRPDGSSIAEGLLTEAKEGSVGRPSPIVGERARLDLLRVEAVRDAAPATTAPPRSLAAPETIHFSVTGRCDQACAGCFYSAQPGSDVAAEHAPWSLFEQVVHEAERARVFQMALGGGEPLLHPQIVDMVRLAREHSIVPNLTTNGNRLTRDLAVALKEAGLGQVQISLNGATEEANAGTRPNFRQAMRALETCREVGLRFGINFLVTRSNLGELSAVVELGRRLGAASVNLLRPKPPTTEGDWLERESLDAEGYGTVKKLLRRLKSKVQSPKSGTLDLGPRTLDCKTTLDASLTFLLTDHPPDQLYRGGIWGCCAARKFVTILQDGAILPCSHVRWSDVGGGDFMRAWWESEIFARFRAQEEGMRGRCRACPYLELCKGCRAAVMAFGGDFSDSDPHCPRGGSSSSEAPAPLNKEGVGEP